MTRGHERTNAQMARFIVFHATKLKDGWTLYTVQVV